MLLPLEYWLKYEPDVLFTTRLKKINNQKINSNKKDALGVFLKTEEGEYMYLLEGWDRNWNTHKPRILTKKKNPKKHKTI